MQILRWLVVAGVILVSVSSGLARCGDGAGDAAAVASARAAVAAACDCAGAPDHRSWVRCASTIADARVAAGLLPKACRRDVRRCAARSTCGRPGAVTCCRTNRRGVTRCATKRSADACRAPKGGSACVGAVPSCCDACEAGGCVAPTTTTSTTTSTTTTSSTTTSSTTTTSTTSMSSTTTSPSTSTTTVTVPPTTTTTVPDPCESLDPVSGSCNGACPAGERCAFNGNYGAGTDSYACRCFPDTANPCSEGGFPQCGGDCLDGRVCQAFDLMSIITVPISLQACACVAPDDPCPGPSDLTTWAPGVCPAGEVCTTRELGVNSFNSTCEPQ